MPQPKFLRLILEDQLDELHFCILPAYRPITSSSKSFRIFSILRQKNFCSPIVFDPYELCRIEAQFGGCIHQS